MSGETSGSDRRAYELFAQWLDLDEPERIRLFDATRREDVSVFGRLHELVRADKDAVRFNFMGSGLIVDSVETADGPHVPQLAGERIGNWELERLIGSGGMGQVWIAHRCDGMHEGKAAIKLLRFVTDPQTDQRFAQEGRILARLAHPNIAMLLDAGFAANGQRYLVLEYIDGERIDQWCDRHLFDVEARLTLFLQVCDAVDFAHANLIVHRDLKPSNILVLDNGSVKLLDFGISKLLESDVETTAQLTGDSVAAMTPGYAAPEQISGGTITIATDIYALGVILYTLLGGSSPYGDEKLRALQLARAVVEHEPKRLSDLIGRRSSSSVAVTRSSTPQRLRQRFRGDLDIIVAKALKKNPSQRYANIRALADDIRRHLEHQPISARDDSPAYRMRKFLRRHWMGAAATAAIVAAVIGGLGASIWQARRAEHEASRAVAVKQFLIGLFDASRNTNAGIQTRQRTVADLLEDGANRLNTDLGSQPDVRDEVYTTLVEIFDSSGEQERSLALARERVKAAESAFGVGDVRVASSLTLLAGVLLNRNQAAEAAPFLARSEQLLDAANDTTSLERARLLLWQGIYKFQTQDTRTFDDSPLIRAVELLRSRYPNEDDLEVALGMYVVLAGSTGHLDLAERAATEMRERAIARYGSEHVYVAQADMTMAGILLKEKKYDAALVRAQAARDGMTRFEGNHHPDVLMAEGDVIAALVGLDRKDEARERFTRFNAERLRDQPDNKRLEATFTKLAESLH